MALQVAFVMQLPLLSEEQEGLVRRYGQEHCEEIRITTPGSTTQVAGILRRPFKNKKVAQTALGINLKAWKITMPKYVRGWYRELSMEQYFAEFKEGPALLGRRLQSVVSGLVSSLIHRGMARAAERAVKAREKVKTISNNRQKAFQLLAGILDRRKKELFVTLVEPILQRRREAELIRKAECDARRIVMEEAREQERKAALELKALMACPLYRARLEKEKVEKARAAEKEKVEQEKEAQKRNVAYHTDRLKRKREEEQAARDQKKQSAQKKPNE
jgi:hypothetical protein